MCNTYDDASEMSGLLKEVIDCKKAAIVAILFLYLVYLATTALIYFFELRKAEEKAESIKTLKRFKLDIEQRQFFMLSIALLIQVITPVPFPIVMLYLYLVTVIVMFVGHLKAEKWIIYFSAVAAQLLFAFILIFFVLINPWCRFYYFRHVVSTPPNSLYSINPNPGTDTNTGNNQTTGNNTNQNVTIPTDQQNTTIPGLL